MEEKKTTRKIVAKLQNIVPEGKHGGPYFVTTVVSGSKINGSITFSLEDWQEDKPPKKSDMGKYLILDDLTKKTNGWRANKARFYRPEDEEEIQNVKSS